MSRKRGDHTSVDVVIPACNAARYIGEAIASALAQEPAVRKVFVVDDGSTDATQDVARGFGPRVDTLRQSNGGAARARNAGIALATAPLVAFLDADDRWLPGHIERGLRNLAARPGNGFVCARLRAFPSPELPPGEQAALRARNAEYQDGWVASTLIVRRDVLERVGGFADDLRVGEVIDWFDRARALGIRGDMLDTVQVERRLHRNNTTRVADLRGYLVAAKRHLDRIRSGGGGPAA